jgi:signal transduction histidine kinase/ActR/RegA family two-component response regulator
VKVRAHLALMSAVILLPVVLLSIVALVILLKAEREAGQRGVRETARAVMLQVDRELALAENTLRVLATSRRLTDGAYPDFARQAAQARSTESSWVILSDGRLEQVLNTRFPEGNGRKHMRPDYLGAVMASGKPGVSSLLHDPDLAGPVVSVDLPIEVNGSRMALTQVFRASHFNDTFDDAPLPPGAIVGIFDGDGVTVARSLRAAELVGKPAAADLLRAMRANREGELRHLTRDGIDVYDFYVRSRRSDWSIVVGVPAASLEANARRAVSVAGVGILAALTAAVLFAILASRRLAIAIADTASAAAVLGRGQRPEFQPTALREIDALQGTLTEAGRLLERERDAREAAEAERVRLLESEQAARQVAESQNRAKDEFLAMLGHELRNPLSAISGAVTVLQSRNAGADSERYARDVVERQTAHLGRIVDDLLDVSRVMTGKIRLDKQRVDLGEALQRCVGTLSAGGRTSRHEVTVRTVSAWIDADVTRLDQVICNLLINAVKYTPEGGRIEAEVRMDDGDAVLKVRDNGVGIAPELLPRIFDVFVQGNPSLDRGQGGLGLGLALVERLTKMHGGSVRAFSEGEGRGSEFELRFPRMPAPAPAAAAPAETPAAPRLRILLVDDHEDARGTTAMLLQIMGHDVVEAADGLAAVERARDSAPDVAVVDIGLPGIDGYEVARRVRADAATRHLALIALTGYGQDDDRRRALDAGFDEHLVKPVEPDALARAIARVRASRGSAGSDASERH